MTYRKDVTVAGIPGIWTTNLTDADTRIFYDTHCRDDKDQLTLHVFHRELKIAWANKTLSFKEGACQWTRIQEKNWVVYRTAYEWEIWLARKQELDELQEEQLQERAVLRQLLRTENQHLYELGRRAVLAKDYQTAERHLIARADLATHIGRLKLDDWWSRGIIENVSRWVTNFPTSTNGIEFLKKYDCRPTSFLAYANFCVLGPRRLTAHSEAEIEKVFDTATNLFPSDGYLFKQICLFWRRRERFSVAIKYCEIAIQNGVCDDTQTGFSGRLKRLAQQQNQCASQEVA